MKHIKNTSCFKKKKALCIFSIFWAILSGILFILKKKQGCCWNKEKKSCYFWNKWNSCCSQKWNTLPNIPTEWTLLWYSRSNGIETEVRIKENDRMRHIYVIGNTGSWKSVLLQNVAIQDIKNGKWVAIFDPHGDLITNIIASIPTDRADDVIIFNPEDKERPLWINLFEAETPTEKDFIANEITEIMLPLFWKNIYSSVIQDIFKNGILTLLEYPKWSTLLDLIPLFSDEKFQKERIQYVTNKVLLSWWKNRYTHFTQQKKHEIIVFLEKFSSEFNDIKHIIWQTKSTFDVSDIIDNSKILLMNLNKGHLWTIKSNFLGWIILTKIKMAMIKRQERKTEERKNFYIYIDEFQNYITSSIEFILTEGRKYRVGLFLVNQYLWQLENDNINLMGSIFWNVWSIISYKIWLSDAEYMEKYYAPIFSQDDLVNLKNYHAVMKLCIDNQPSIPFSIMHQKPIEEKWDENNIKAVIELSRLKYGRDKNMIEEEMKKRIQE